MPQQTLRGEAAQPPADPEGAPESGNELIGGMMFNALPARLRVVLQSRLVAGETGAMAVENGIIAGLIAIVVICAVGALGGAVLGWADAGTTMIAP